MAYNISPFGPDDDCSDETFDSRIAKCMALTFAGYAVSGLIAMNLPEAVVPVIGATLRGFVFGCGAAISVGAAAYYTLIKHGRSDDDRTE